MLLPDLLPSALAPLLSPAARLLDIVHVTHDSRRVQQGSLFAAWRGQVRDGHTFVAAALAQGARFVLSQRPLGDAVPHLVCNDPRRVLAVASQRLYAARSALLPLVGITGTNGKTTCAHLVASMLAARGTHASAIGTLGHSDVHADGRIDRAPLAGTLTTPEAADLQACLAACADAGSNGAAIEVTSIALSQGRLEGVLFDVCAMTNFSQDHLDVHGTMQAYGEAKARLFHAHAKLGARFVCNGDDPFQRSLALPSRPTLWFSAHAAASGAPRADVYVRRQRLTRAGIDIDVHTPRGALVVHSPLVGDFNVENVLLAIGVGLALDVSDDAIVRGIAALRAVPGRLERFGGGEGAPLILVDYAHTPDALQRTLVVARQLTEQGRLFCVFGCGGDRDASKRAPMGAIAVAHSDWAIVTNDNPRSEDPARIAAHIVAGMGAAPPVDVPPARRRASGQPAGHTVCLDRADAIARAIAQAQPGDTVLIAGKGHEPVQFVGATAYPFDDRQHAAHALQRR